MLLFMGLGRLGNVGRVTLFKYCENICEQKIIMKIRVMLFKQ